MSDQVDDTGGTDPVVAYRARLRRNRLLFFAGFVLIAVAGGLWAGLSKESIGGDGGVIINGDFEGPIGFEEDVFIEDMPAGFENTTTAVP
ncbi:MAG: hypothetical protein GY708_26800 [Actinomycetia bacterium]|nr:hypothetical protein [Actinomycetes bacterium]